MGATPRDRGGESPRLSAPWLSMATSEALMGMFSGETRRPPVGLWLK